MKSHTYNVAVTWTGDRGEGTKSYTGYSRDHEITAAGKPVVLGSSDPHFRGDAARYNPEELLVASLSACHLLWYLHLCASHGIVVVEYRDEARGEMAEESGAGRFTAVVLRPRVKVAEGSDRQKAMVLHEEAHRLCFIANSVNFPVSCEPAVA